MLSTYSIAFVARRFDQAYRKEKGDKTSRRHEQRNGSMPLRSTVLDSLQPRLFSSSTTATPNNYQLPPQPQIRVADFASI